MKTKQNITKILILNLVAFLSFCGQATPTDPGDEEKEPKIYTFTSPGNFTVTPKDRGAILTYTYNPAVEGGYKIYFGDTDALTGFAGSIPSPVATNANAVTVGGLTNGTTYYFAVEAVKANGDVSSRTQTMTVVPVAPPATLVEKEINAELHVCFDEIDKIKFEDGKIKLSYHQGGSSFPGADGDCDFGGIQLQTFAEGVSQFYPVSPWTPTAVGQELTISLFNIAPEGKFYITGLEPVEEKCASVSFSGNKARVSSEGSDTIVLDATECPDNKVYSFYGENSIKFKLHYTKEE